MAILLWSLLNIAVLVGLLYTFGRVALVVKRRFGLGFALLFCLGLLAVGGNKVNSATPLTPTKNLLGTLVTGTPLGNSSSLQTIPLGVGAPTIHVLAEYWIKPDTLKPRGLYITTAGLLFGHQWQPIYGAMVQRSTQLHYTATVRHDWMLLGNSVFSSVHEYAGLLPAN